MSQQTDIRPTALVTGCSSGVGHALALELASRGLKVFATARSRSSIADLEEEGIETVALEVDDEESVRNCKAEVEKMLGGRGLDYLINNAGRNYTVPALDIDLAEARATFETNVIGVAHMCQVFAPLLVQAKGTIVQLGSLAGTLPYVFGSVYNASKAALQAYSNTLRVELAPFGVTVITLITGGVSSNIARTHRTLPQTSMYLPLEEDYVRRQTHSQEGAMDARVFARDVASKILKRDSLWNLWGLLGDRRRRWYWVGAKVWIVWAICGGWAWNGIADMGMVRMFRLWKLKQPKKM